jgi:hypothetical protein
MVAALFFTIVGIAFCFWGRKIVETFAFIIFGIVGGILGLFIGLFLAGILGLTGMLFFVMAFGLCLLGIILGAVLSKWFLYGLIVGYCAINAFLFTLVMVYGRFGSQIIEIIIAGVVAIVVAIVLKIFIERILAAVTAFFGASLIGIAGMSVAIFVADRFADHEFKGMSYLILLGVVIGVVIILGIAGTVKQLSGKSPPKQQSRRRR